MQKLETYMKKKGQPNGLIPNCSAHWKNLLDQSQWITSHGRLSLGEAYIKLWQTLVALKAVMNGYTIDEWPADRIHGLSKQILKGARAVQAEFKAKGIKHVGESVRVFHAKAKKIAEDIERQHPGALR